MGNDVSSKHLRTATELTLIADLRSGFVETADVLSFPTRLGALLKTFFELRKIGIEQQASGYIGPLERLRSLYFVRWSILDGKKLLLAVNFDRPWEPYIRGIVDYAGPFLDVIFCHCADYAGNSTRDGYVKFGNWVRAKQVEVAFLHAADPDMTVDDQRYLRELERRLSDPSIKNLPESLATMAVGDRGLDNIPPAPTLSMEQRFESLARATTAFYNLDPWFPAVNANSPGDDREFFHRSAWQLLEGLVPVPPGVSPEKALELARRQLPKHLADFLDTLQGYKPKTLPRVAATKETPDVAENVQGNILTSYEGMTHGLTALVRFDTTAAARAFVRDLRVTPDKDAKKENAVPLNVALTFAGLRTLGLSATELASFPKEFRDGMEARAGLLGDVSAEHPSQWQRPRLNWPAGSEEREPIPLDTVDLVLTIQQHRDSVGADDHRFTRNHPLLPELEELFTDRAGVQVLHVQPLLRTYFPPKSEQAGKIVREHFGYADGLSQPVPATRTAPGTDQDRVALGELILGHENDRGELYPQGDPALFANGSFVVLRKLEQNVLALKRFISENAQHFSGKEEELYARLMGRRPSGSTLVGRGGPNTNAFSYENDPNGKACPFASHVRRANPREKDQISVHGLPVRTPRILRRGFSYGPRSIDGVKEDDDARGLLFVGYNASIAEQFEIIQRWLNGANSTGILSSQSDPLTSQRAPQQLTVWEDNKLVTLQKKEPFVTLRWGMYLFAPSLSALRALGERDEQTDSRKLEADRAELVAEGQKLIRGLKALEMLANGDPAKLSELKDQWKLVLEDRGARDKARAVWAAVRASGGALRTPYGVLVGSAEGVQSALTDETTCSVREYYRRMAVSVGPMYLGMDRCPVHKQAERTPSDAEYEASVLPAREACDSTYDQASKKANAFIYGLSRSQSYRAARQVAERVLNKKLEEQRAEEATKGRPSRPLLLDLKEYGGAVGTLLCKGWFGAPNDHVGFKDTFLPGGQYIFYPNPGAPVERLATAAQGRIAAAETAAREAKPAMLAALEGESEAAVGRALIGATQGFLAATVGSFLSVTVQWLENGKLWRLKEWLHLAPDGAPLLANAEPAAAAVADDVLLTREMLVGMRGGPVPDLLHRAVVSPKQLAGGKLTAVPGERLVLSLASALADEPENFDLLFGGGYSPRKSDGEPVHACPGKEAALGTILALLVTLLSKPDPKREGPVAISLAL
jgi:Dyp-type peroxidase family